MADSPLDLDLCYARGAATPCATMSKVPAA